MVEEKSITQVIEEVCEKMCNDYCKYPEKYTAEEWDSMMDEVCNNCPLNRLN